MSKKNLLNEGQIRQFMKLASLGPLTQGFVEGLNTAHELEELRTGVTGALGPKSGAANPGHGRGQGEAPDGSLFEEDELEATEDELGDMDAEADFEGDEIEDLEGDMGAEEASAGRMVSVDDFLAALERALEDAMGDEVEIDSSELEDEDELEADVELDAGVTDLRWTLKLKMKRCSQKLEPTILAPARATKERMPTIPKHVTTVAAAIVRATKVPAVARIMSPPRRATSLRPTNPAAAAKRRATRPMSTRPPTNSWSRSPSVWLHEF